MQESIRRFRDVKRAETHVPRKEIETPDLTRRDFLRGAGTTIGAAAAFSALPSFLTKEIAESRSHADVIGTKIRETYIDDAVATIQKAVRSKSMYDALEGRGKNTDELISRVLRPLMHPIDRDYVAGTKYDARIEREKHCIQIAYRRHAETITLVSDHMRDTIRKAYPTFGYGNGVFWGKNNQLLTVHHVLEAMHNFPVPNISRDLTIMQTNDLDIAKPFQVLHDDSSLTNEQIHGSYVSVEGIDPDETSDNGFKSYPGVAVRLHRGFVKKVFNSSPAVIERLSRSFILALPPGEAVGEPDQPAVGMSGSPVFMYRNGSRVLAGIFHSTFPLLDPATQRTVDLGFFHGIEEVRAEFNAYKRKSA